MIQSLLEKYTTAADKFDLDTLKTCERNYSLVTLCILSAEHGAKYNAWLVKCALVLAEVAHGYR